MKPIQPFKKVLRPGTAKDGDVFVKVEYDLTEDGDAERRKPRLSLSGVVGPYPSGNAAGGCGQINPAAIESLAPGWTPAMLERLWGAWKRWHLNDMRAGCEHQRAEGWGEKELVLANGEKKLSTWVTPAEHPDGVLCKPCPVCGYKYGTAWLCEEVPAEVLEFLRGLPDSDVPYPWRSF
jgi:hypothetical protein